MAILVIFAQQKRLKKIKKEFDDQRAAIYNKGINNKTLKK